MLEVHGERQKMSSFAILGWATPTRPATHSVAEAGLSHLPEQHIRPHMRQLQGTWRGPGSKIRVGTTQGQRPRHPLEAKWEAGWREPSRRNKLLIVVLPSYSDKETEETWNVLTGAQSSGQGRSQSTISPSLGSHWCL